MSETNELEPIDARAVAVIKGLVMDGTRKANSGHPGGPMSSADFAYVLYREFLNFHPGDPGWFNRDRFVLSAGHESMLLYSLLLLCGFLEMDDLKDFRQLHSVTPGHPERHLTPGVEATTGPLGQGFSMAVGMAVAEAHLRARFAADFPDLPGLIDHFTYALASDGDLQECVGLSSAALAGTWGLGRLIVFYDSNRVQLAGPTSRADKTDYATVFRGFGWQVLEIDGHDHAQIRAAIAEGKKESAKPTLIIGHTTIAKGTATREGDYKTHGEPLPPEEILATKKKLGLPEDETFFLPEEVVTRFRTRFAEMGGRADAWKSRLVARQQADATFAAAWGAMLFGGLATGYSWPAFEPGKKMATRQAWGACLMALKDQLPFFAGGSADLDPSNQTEKFRDAAGVFSPENPVGRYLAFGVREFSMGAVVNGLALHGGIVPFGATFLTFSDYQRNALRMSAIQNLPVLHVFTHDSIFLGEDGPTHQPVEHLSSLRLIPNMLVMRPADARETAACLETALTQESRPTCIALTRQGLPTLDPAAHPQVEAGVKRGGYVLKDSEGEPEVLVIATGSEVALALAAVETLPERKIRVVSMPCTRLFDGQDQEYRDSVLPPSVTRRVAVEAGQTDFWRKYVGLEGQGGRVLGIDHFGDSAPAEALAEEYGFTPANLAAMIESLFA